ncbi:MAG: hypothetical protein ACO3M5_08710 [Saprospiraceae bacterium]|jgi:hypothetical protein|nr:hypothetical protein [Chitinophagia bacterium]
MMKKTLLLSLMLALLSSCGGDGNSKSNELSPEKKAYLEEHGHDHDHDHGDTPKAIENNSRTSVPVERKATTPFNEPANNPYKTKAQMQADAKEEIKPASREVPDACTLVTDAFIGKVIGVDAMGINIKDGSSAASPYARSCFFRWDHKGIPNSGVLIQVSDNPVPEEFPEWAAYYIQAKKNQGEKSPDGAFEFRYEDFKGLGEAGAYSFELHRYMWRDKDDFVYLIAFNLPATEAEELEWARAIGEEIMKNVKF